MRPALLFTACYGAGLATGLLRFGSPWCAGLVLVAAALARRPVLLLMAAAATLGAANGALATAADRDRCAARLPPGRQLVTVRLAEPAWPEGGQVQVVPLGARCHGEVAARWPT